MNRIIKMLAGGDRRSTGHSEEVAAEVLADDSLFPDLFEGLLSDDAIIRSRAAHALMQIAPTRPDLVRPYKEVLMQDVARIKQWEVREQLCKILPRLGLTRAEIAYAVEIFRGYLNDKSSIVRTCALQALADLTEMEPSLKPEIMPTIEELTQTGTPAMRARGRKLLIKLRKDRRHQ